MEHLNIFGLIFMVIIMIPNIVFAFKCPNGFHNAWRNKKVELLEQIGCFGCFVLMIFNIPSTWFGFSSDEAFAIYLIVNSVMVICYCLIWIICFKRNTVFRALALSIIPSFIFLFSGIMSHSIFLLLAAIIFAPCHIIISYKNAVLTNDMKFRNK